MRNDTDKNENTVTKYFSTALETLNVENETEVRLLCNTNNLPSLKHLHFGEHTGSLHPSDAVCMGSHYLEEITVAENNPYLTAENNILYSKDKTVLYRFPSDRTGSFKVPNTVQQIAPHAFEHTHLTELVIPASVTNQDGSCLIRSTTMKKLTIDRNSFKNTESVFDKEKPCFHMYRCCPVLKELVIRDSKPFVFTDTLLLQNSHIVPFLYDIYCIVRPSDSNDLTPSQAVRNMTDKNSLLLYHDCKDLLTVLQACLSVNPESTFHALKENRTKISTIAARTGSTALLQFMADNHLLTKASIDKMKETSTKHRQSDFTAQLLSLFPNTAENPA